MHNEIILKVTRFLVVVLLSASFFLPTAFTSLKMVLLALILGLIFVHSLINKEIVTYKPFVLYSFICMILGTLFTLHGLIMGNPGATASVTVMILYPVVFVIIISLYRPNDYKFFENFFIFSLAATLVVFILFILATINILPNIFLDTFTSIFGDEAMYSFQNGMPLFALPSIQVIFFLLPFLIFHTFLGHRTIKRKMLLYGLIFITCIIVVLTGRRALLVTVIFSIVVNYSIYSLFIAKRRTTPRTNILRKVLVLICVIPLISGGISVVNTYEFIDTDAVKDNIFSVINFTSDDSNLERVYQFRALVDGIENHPLLGNGAGAVAAYTRSDETPWAYELSYIAFPFHYGIPALFFYAFGVVWIFFSLINIARKLNAEEARFIVGVAAGYLSFIVANSSNPYLGKFDFMWIIFLPASIVGAYNIYKKI